jgi:TolB-like protein/lipopolysaccharide biosynthesis regulator YciM
LPFDNLGRDENVDDFADGLTDEIITAFSRQTGMTVLARSSTLLFKGKAVDVTEVGRKLGANYVLQGSVRKAGSRVRVAAQLVEADTGNHLWGDQFDGELADVFTLQDEVTFNIVAATRSQIHVKDAERVRDVPEDQLSDNELLALASQRMQAIGAEDQREAARLSGLVVQRSPRNAMALAMLASCALLENEYDYKEISEQDSARSFDLIDRSVQLNEESDYAHFVRGRLLLEVRREHSLAIAEAERALELNPNYLYGYVLLGYATICRGEPERGMALVEKALRADPRRTRFAYFEILAIGKFLLEDYAAALDLAETAAQRAGYLPYLRVLLAVIHAEMGQIEKAREQVEALIEVAPEATIESIRRPPFKDEADTKRFIEGLRHAGFPENAEAPAENGQLPLPDKPSIAVLPFENISGEPEQDPFADGITEEIITTLSKVSKLFVIARNSTLVYKGRAVDIREVGREQGVQYVLEGSVRSGGERLRVTAQLIEAETGRHVWAQRYDREFGDVLALQDDVTKEIVSALQVELTAGEQARLAAQGTKNAEAWQLTFEGRDLVHEHHKDSVQKGKRLLEQAVGLDETYALAWDALSEAYWKEARNAGWSASPERSFERAVEANDRALALDPENADALAMRSVIMVTQRDFDGALALAEKALRLAHSNANAIALAAITLYACGMAEEAIRQTELAARHCPRYPPWYLLMLARCHWMLKHDDQALAAARAAIAADPELSLNYVVLAMVHAEAGRDSEARKAVDALLRIDPTFSATTHMRGLPLRDPELEARARSALQKAGIPD